MKIDEKWVIERPKEALDLPIKFGRWLSLEYNPSDGINYWHNHEGGEDKTTEDLYQYWIDNIYKP